MRTRRTREAGRGFGGAARRSGARRARMGLVMATALVAQACTAGMHTQVEEAVIPVSPPVVTRLAVMPVTTQPGSEGVRPELTRAVVEALSAAFPGVELVPPHEAARRLDHAGAATGYARLIEDYERAGTVSAERVGRVAGAVGAPLLLQLRGAYLHERFLDPYLFDDELAEEDRQVLEVVVRLWGEGVSGPLWEAVLRTRSETDDFVWNTRDRGELLEQMAQRLAERIPLAVPTSTREASPPDAR